MHKQALLNPQRITILITVSCYVLCQATGCAECTCSSNELTCYIIDNNGFVVASEAIGETGKFFGEVEGNVMNALVNEKVFRKVHIIDYQAICIHASEDTNRASFLTTVSLISHGFDISILSSTEGVGTKSC